MSYKPNNDGTLIFNGDPDTAAAPVPGVRSIPTSRGILVGKTRAKEVAAAVDAMALRVAGGRERIRPEAGPH